MHLKVETWHLNNTKVQQIVCAFQLQKSVFAKRRKKQGKYRPREK